MPATEFVSTEPATGTVVWRGHTGDAAREIAIARGAWAEWAARPLAVRIETLRRFANVIRGRGEVLADLIARETGRPLWDARAEVDAVVKSAEHAVSAYSDRTAQRRLEGEMGARQALRHKPHGVLGLLGPFNAPASIPCGHIVPALLAGNAVVFKPSEKAPAVGSFLVESCHAAGLPEGVLRFLAGGETEGQALAADPGLDGLLFTGSARVGRALHREFAERPDKILALEMGGNNPLVVWDTPHIAAAAVVAVQSAYLASGQRCTAARRLIVHDGAHQPLIDEICKLIGRIIVDGPLAKPQPFMGPVIDNAAADRIQEAFLNLIVKGGRPIAQLARRDPALPFLSPALIDVTGIAQRPDEEIFGPVLQIIRVPDFDAAIVEANNTHFGLCAALIGGSPTLYDRFWANARAGIVNWNRPTNGAPVHAPLGGIGLSGNHRPSAYYAADYCAYPVVSSEAEQPRAVIGIGLHDES
jgi:succinylglutamic semialdehyde dehydrogenase